VLEPETAPGVAADDDVAANRTAAAEDGGTKRMSQWQARHDLARHRAETERLRVLVEFLSRPIHAHGGTEPDPDIITAYNLAVEAALQGIRRAASGD
jgi:hypothetical protein